MIRYRQSFIPARINGQKKELFSGIGSGIMWLIVYCGYGLAFYYGVGFILDDRTKTIKEILKFNSSWFKTKKI